MKQETLKEAVIRLTSDEKDIAKRLEAVYYITKGAKWQQEQDKKMYSEEEVRDAYRWGTLVNQGTKEHFNEFINNLNNK
jgi:hypothetical protein